MALVELHPVSGGTAALELNRPGSLNALNWQAMEQFAAHVEALHQQPDLRALVVYGAGRAFCSGGDLFELHGYPERADVWKACHAQRSPRSRARQSGAAPKSP
jgi:enoyl-CoA hydratase/carnithine racemase